MPKLPQSLRRTNGALSSPEKYRIAINLDDLDRMPDVIRRKLLAGKVAVKPIRVNSINDETAVPFTCDDLTAACICDLIRSNDAKLEETPTRVYLKRGAGWNRLRTEDSLSILIDGRPMLSPALFGTKLEAIPLETEAVL